MKKQYKKKKRITNLDKLTNLIFALNNRKF